MPTGSIVACDPFVFFDTVPFTQRVPAGKYTVLASIAQLNAEERTAYLKLKISDELTMHWELAVLPGQDPKTLLPGMYFGYPVDSGVGSMMDAGAAAYFLKKLEDEASHNRDDYANFMVSEMEKKRVQTWDWGIFGQPGSPANMVAVSSGLGDGRYPSYFGFDAEGRVTEFVTDFLLVD